MKKLLFLTLFVLANSLLDSCATDDSFAFDLELTGAENVTMQSYEKLQSGDTAAAQEYAIALSGAAEVQLSDAAWDFGSKLMADAAYQLADPISNISITSSADLSLSFPAGSELKTLFEVQEVQQTCIGNPTAANDCVTNYSSFDFINSIEQGFNDRLAVGFVEREGSLFLFKLNTTESTVAGKHVFKVNMRFQSGKSVQLITPEVYIE